MTDEEIMLDGTSSCYTLTSRFYPYNYINNENHIWDIVARDGDNGIRLKFETFDLEYSYDYLDIGVGAFTEDSEPVFRLTGSLGYSFAFDPKEGVDRHGKEQPYMHRLVPAEEETQQEQVSSVDGLKSWIRPTSSDFCSNSTTYYDQVDFPEVIHLKSPTIWLRMLSDTSVTERGFSLKVTSTSFGGMRESIKCALETVDCYESMH